MTPQQVNAASRDHTQRYIKPLLLRTIFLFSSSSSPLAPKITIKRTIYHIIIVFYLDIDIASTNSNIAIHILHPSTYQPRTLLSTPRPQQTCTLVVEDRTKVETDAVAADSPPVAWQEDSEDGEVHHAPTTRAATPVATATIPNPTNRAHIPGTMEAEVFQVKDTAAVPAMLLRVIAGDRLHWRITRSRICNGDFELRLERRPGTLTLPMPPGLPPTMGDPAQWDLLARGFTAADTIRGTGARGRWVGGAACMAVWARAWEDLGDFLEDREAWPWVWEGEWVDA